MELTVTNIIDETDSVRSFILNGFFDFNSGNRMECEIFGHKRAFSICTSPTEGVMAFTTNIDNDPNGPLSSLNVGSSISVTGPIGSFSLDQDVPKPIVMIAGGIAVAPMRSMIKYAMDTDFPASIKLIHSIKTANDIIYEDDFDKWSEESDKFWYIPTLTQSEPSDWYGELGRINKEILERHIERDSVFYISGKQSFVDHVISTLNDIGVPQDMIRTEVFS